MLFTGSPANYNGASPDSINIFVTEVDGQTGHEIPGIQAWYLAGRGHITLMDGITGGHQASG